LAFRFGKYYAPHFATVGWQDRSHTDPARMCAMRIIEHFARDMVTSALRFYGKKRFLKMLGAYTNRSRKLKKWGFVR
jgi:hypothetical protein